MMNCTQFREALHCYLDGELSAGASAAADAHRKECAECSRAAARVLDLKGAVRQAAHAATPPAGLDARIRAAVAGPWARPWAALVAFAPRHRAVALAAAVLILAVVIGARAPFEAGVANAMARLAVQLDAASPVVLEGTILCRDCELERRYGVGASCSLIGHRGAIATPDGQIWNIVEQESSATLIHDESLLGRTVVVRGRLFRGSHALVVDSYQLGS